VSFILAHIAEPGVVEQVGSVRRVVFGELDGSRSERVTRLLAEFRKAEIDTDLADDIRVVMWDKFAYLCALAGLTAVTRLPIDMLLAVPETRNLFREAVREDERHASEDMLGPDASSDFLLIIDSVLKGEDSCLRPQQGPEQRGCLIGVVRLHAEDDGVARADLCGIVACRDSNGEVPVVSANLKTAFSDGSQMIAAGNEANLCTGRGQQGAVVAADSTSADDSDLHLPDLFAVRRG
jgi:hypothetical protein